VFVESFWREKTSHFMVKKNAVAGCVVITKEGTLDFKFSARFNPSKQARLAALVETPLQNNTFAHTDLLRAHRTIKWSPIDEKSVHVHVVNHFISI
jgi:hypothetical protein